ncbi:YtxH domain-containing protein [Candidatus Saccharibacteria bacterium]|nr:YtxH domain-containing protein [Candidatus Saccharibacteria bacterium]
MRKRDRSVAVGTLIAAGIGYAAGVLTAPKSGRETRKGIQKTATKAKKDAEKNLKNLHGELTDLIDTSKKRATKIKTGTVTEFNDALAKAQKAKQKVGELLSALHEGDTEDRDLKQAVKDVNQAIDHLRIFLEKTNGPKAK